MLFIFYPNTPSACFLQTINPIIIMAIPTFDMLLRPVLELSTKENITRRTATAAMSDLFKLSPEERVETIPTGGATLINNRTGWAMSHLTKGGLINKVEKFTYRATPKGQKYLTSHTGPITTSDLRMIEGLVEAWAAASKKNAMKKTAADLEVTNSGNGDTTTPEESIDEAVETLGDKLRLELLDQLKDVDPYRFEQIVIDLLFAMGYGGSREEAAKVTKKSGDEGIDGVINEDRLGLDVIYVQAKRWKDSVGRIEVQNFVGALAGKHATKGVFITTSDFNNNAVEYAKNVQHKVILIGGMRLADLMVEHDVGVSTTRTIRIKRLDSDYFEEN
jgi:restriction system protein